MNTPNIPNTPNYIILRTPIATTELTGAKELYRKRYPRA
jgi:hypothetical protein